MQSDLSPSPALSVPQNAVLDRIRRFIDDPHDRDLVRAGEFRLAGLAGTGKTTIIAALAARDPGVLVASLTGKAASVLIRKGVAGASTLHRLLYRAHPTTRYDERLRCEMQYWRFTPRRPGEIDASVIIVDEGSMVTPDLYEHLRSHRIPLVIVGDHGQLLPIGDDLGLLVERDATLEAIHRHAEDSPILRFAHALRAGLPIEATREPNLTVRSFDSFEDANGADVVICATNRTRHAVNAWIRMRRGFGAPLCVGDKLVCLQNDYDRGVFNGQSFTLASIGHDARGIVELTLRDEQGETYHAPAWIDAFGSDSHTPRSHLAVRLDYGYALTAHKAQGSEWPHVAVIDEFTPWLADRFGGNRWRYTAATRAQRQLTYLV